MPVFLFTLENRLALFEHTTTFGFNRTFLNSAASALEFYDMAAESKSTRLGGSDNSASEHIYST